MAVKTGLNREEAIKELECLFCWAELYYLGWHIDKNERTQQQIEDHKIFYGLE